MEQNENKSGCFDNSIGAFLSHIESLWTSLPIVLNTINSTNNIAVLNHNKFLDENCEYVEDERHYIIKSEHRRKNEILRKSALNSSIARKIINRNFLVSLISQFDTYTSDLIKSIFMLRPDLLNNSEKILTFSELLKFSDINEAKQYIIEKEIETVLRESHTEQFIWFEKKLKIELRKDLSIWTTFIEVTQRRNLFVHNDGKVSNQYLNVCKANNVILPADLKLGDELEIDVKYFEKAFKCLFEIGVKLNQVIRRNLLPNEIETADTSFLNISFELIQNRQYELAKELYDFSDKYIKRFSTDDLRLRIILNRAQTYKWLNQEEECKKIIKSEDWSARADLYKLASSVLINDYPNSILIMKNIGDNPKIIEKTFYRDWPIFKLFIQTQEFKDAYFEIFGESFEITEEKNNTVQLEILTDK